MSENDFKLRQRKYIDESLITAYLFELEKQIKVEALAVFGSRARGDAYVTSDYDIAVVSDDFLKMSKFERIFLLLDCWNGDFALEPVAYTKDEFNRSSGLLIWDILEDGVLFKDSGIFRKRRSIHEKLKAAGKLKKVEGGWKFSDAS